MLPDDARDPAAEAVAPWDVEPPGDGQAGDRSAPEWSRSRSALEPPRAWRSREKLFARGARTLTNGELIELLAGGERRPGRASTAVAGLLRRHGLIGLAGIAPREWAAQRGIGRNGAAAIVAAFEIGRRAFGCGGDDERPRVARPGDAFARVRDLRKATKEHLVGLYLDAQNGLIARETVSIGSLNTTRTHPREILYPAVCHLAMGFILVHNHPSGCLEPSEEDVEFTRSVRRAGELMGIELYDHLIVGAGGYTSLRERGVL